MLKEFSRHQLFESAAVAKLGGVKTDKPFCNFEHKNMQTAVALDHTMDLFCSKDRRSKTLH